MKNEKQLNVEIKKRLVEVEYDCEEFNHEYCDINCKGKRKELVDLYQLISDGLNETLLKQKDEENEQLTKKVSKLQFDLSKAKSHIDKIKEAWIDYQMVKDVDPDFHKYVNYIILGK